MSVPVQFIVAAFPDPDQAGQLLDDLKLGRRVGLIGIIDAAAVVKDDQGQLKITNAKHRGRRGFFTGGAVGGVLALLAGPLGWGTAAGAGAVGAVLGRARNLPFKSAVEDLAESLTPGSSLLVAMVEHTWVQAMEELVEELGAQVIREEMKADIRAQLEEGGNLAFTAAASQDGAGVARIAGNADGSVEVSGALASEDGILLGAAMLTDEELPAVETDSTERD